MSAPPEPPATLQPLADDLAAALDPVVFARSVGIEPDGWQAEVLRSAERRMLLNCSRQSGKTTTTALLGLHQAVYVPGSLVLILSPSLRQSAEFFRTLARLYTATGGTVPPKAESALRLELANGSRVISLPASEATVRGFAGVDLLLFDEASRVPDDLYHACTPMTATRPDARIIALSTPFGRRGWWSDAWHSTRPWKRVKVTAHDCPRIDAAWLEQERAEIGDWWFRQEYECEFVDEVSQVFSTEDIILAQSREYVETWQL